MFIKNAVETSTNSFCFIFQKRPERGARVVRIKQKDWQVTQNCDVYIAHKVNNDYWNLPRSKWANPHGRHELEKYAVHVRRKLWHDLDSLEGKLLGCWCDESHHCHGSVLVDLLEEKKIKELGDKIRKCGLRVDPSDLAEIRHAYDWYCEDHRYLAYATRLDKTDVFYFQTTVHLALQHIWGINGIKGWRAYTNDDKLLWIVGLYDGPQPLGPFWDEDANFETLRQSPLTYNPEMPHFLDLFSFARMLQPSLDDQLELWEQALREATLYLTLHRSIVRRVGDVTQVDMDDHDLTKSRLVQMALAYAWHWPAKRDQKLLHAAKLAITAGHCELENHHPECENIGFDEVDAKKLLIDRVAVHLQKDPMDKKNGWAVDPRWIPEKYAAEWEALKNENKHTDLYTECLWKARKDLKPHHLRTTGFGDWWMPPLLAAKYEAGASIIN